jgi:hypothetical protein
MKARAASVSLLVLLTFSSDLGWSQEAAPNVKYSWMLPKTVLDATITYSLVSCEDTRYGANLKIKITPTLAARSLPDTHVGRIAFKPTEETPSFWEDRNITVKTFPGSHILSSIASSPTSQTGQIITNILTGLTKIVAVGLGVPSVPFSTAPPPPPPPPATKCGKAARIVADIAAKKGEIIKAQMQLATGVDEAIQKKLNAQIQALQAVVGYLQTALDTTHAIVIKRTIDPGFTPVDINSAPYPNLFSDSALPEPHPIEANGLVARFRPTSNEVTEVGWYEDATKLTKEWARLEVNVYMNFEDAVLSVSKKNNKYLQTPVSEAKGEIFRDVAYIPIVVWRGPKTSTPSSDDPLESVQLTQVQMMAFGQYGRAQILPFNAEAFKSLTWSISFLENGEVTDAQFSHKSWGQSATSAFSAAAGAANSIAAEQRSSTSVSSQASAVQAQADLIYQMNRLQQCEKNPASCPK